MEPFLPLSRQLLLDEAIPLPEITRVVLEMVLMLYKDMDNGAEHYADEIAGIIQEELYGTKLYRVAQESDLAGFS